MSTYEKARDIADKLTDIIYAATPVCVPVCRIEPREVLKKCSSEELEFYHKKIFEERKK